MKYSQKKIEEIMLRMFLVFSESYFYDHKLIRDYCQTFKIPRSLGDDIAGFVQSKMSKEFKAIKKRIDKERKDLIESLDKSAQKQKDDHLSLSGYNGG